MPLLHACYRRHDLSGCAIAALERIVVDEGLLHRVQRAVGRGDSFDRRHRMTLDRSRKGKTGQNPPSIDKDGTRTALAVITAFLRTCEAEMFAKRIKDRGADVECHTML